MFNTLEKFTATCIALLLLAGCQTLSNIIPDALLAPEPPATILAEVAPQSAEATAEVFANFKEVIEGNAQDVQLEPGDVVYVPPTTLTSWARVIDKLLPTIQTLQVGIILGSS